jgi:hypothetical protein
MHPTMFSHQMGGLMAKELISILGVKGLNLTSDIVVVHNGMLILYVL